MSYEITTGAGAGFYIYRVQREHVAKCATREEAQRICAALVAAENKPQKPAIRIVASADDLSEKDAAVRRALHRVWQGEDMKDAAASEGLDWRVVAAANAWSQSSQYNGKYGKVYAAE